MNKDQARAVEGGLQAHSVGALYPFTVVAIDHHTHGLSWHIQNVQTGEYATLPRLDDGPSALRSWPRAEFAANFLAHALHGTDWAVGALGRDDDGALWVIPPHLKRTARQEYYDSFDSALDSI